MLCVRGSLSTDSYVIRSPLISASTASCVETKSASCAVMMYVFQVTHDYQILSAIALDVLLEEIKPERTSLYLSQIPRRCATYVP